jgi:flagellar basal-body rod protein FlgC
MVDVLTRESTSAALNAERMGLDLIGENISQAHTTRGPDGRLYRRKVVVVEPTTQPALGSGTPTQTPTLKVGRVDKDPRPVQAHDPGHRDTHEHGLVAIPDMNVNEEIVDLISASRAFEANLALIKNAQTIALQIQASPKQ